jgi:L-amino acid N-acyltransferase YncA
MNTPLIRDSRDDDVAAIQSLYAHHVLHGTGTFELEPPTPDEMRARRAEVLRNGFPHLVAEAGGELLEGCGDVGGHGVLLCCAACGHVTKWEV